MSPPRSARASWSCWSSSSLCPPGACTFSAGSSFCEEQQERHCQSFFGGKHHVASLCTRTRGGQGTSSVASRPAPQPVLTHGWGYDCLSLRAWCRLGCISRLGTPPAVTASRGGPLATFRPDVTASSQSDVVPTQSRQL